jgi:predicted anti-sigma-YlaC factor YlaD
MDPSPIDPPTACSAVTDALSARLDGEEHPLDAAEVERHLVDCGRCARYEQAAARAEDRFRSLRESPVADRAPAILAALTEEQAASGRQRTLELRWLVALAGVVQLAFALPALAGAVGPDLHVGRDLGALQLALGVGLILAAWQPQRSAGVLPIAAVVAVAAVAAAGIDILSGAATLGAELTHLAEVIGVLALWALRRRVPSGPPSIRAAWSSA